MIYGTISEEGKLLFTWQTNAERILMENILHQQRRKEFFDDHALIETI